MRKFALTLGLVVALFSLYLVWLEFGPNENLPSLSQSSVSPATEEPAASNLFQYDSSLDEKNISADQTSEPAPTQPPRVQSLPTLDLSDAEFGLAVAELVGHSYFARYFVSKSLIRQFVVTIDNLPTAKVPYKHLFIVPAKGSFLVSPIEQNQFVIDQRNKDRYLPYIQLIESIDFEKMVDLYVFYYPLFQDAYEELGYTNRQFHDRLLSVLEHLLATPNVEDSFRFTQPKVLYTFANKEFESLSAGEKLLLRIGQGNRQRVIENLKEIATLLRSAELKN